ncbi:hypothetical protein E1A91_D10G115700v1 [Gossypium mustelinum]|uniref:Uncharacterized protein n=1 Tax=Gossypium mustelinum TaxID=34275 RepID=A0A5D2T5U6_GOSMU|nr:hypothetical protein E1A91_D10G115700v1 [Gossypium mustelinum]
MAPPQLPLPFPPNPTWIKCLLFIILQRLSPLVSRWWQVGEEEQSIKGEIGPERSKGIIRGAEDSVEMEECGTKETGHQNCYHPCHYLSLAKLAFLKCLGLDSLSEPRSKSNEQTKPR